MEYLHDVNVYKDIGTLGPGPNCEKWDVKSFWLSMQYKTDFAKYLVSRSPASCA